MTSTPAATGLAATPDARRTDTRDRILAVATRMFRENGYAATSTQAIADELGVTKAALYYHFASKEEILVALKQPVIDGLGQVLAKPADCTTPAGRRAFLTDMVATLITSGADMASLMTDSRATFELRSAMEKSGLPQQAAGVLVAGLAGVKDPAKAPPDVVMRVSAAFGALHGAFDGWLMLNPGKADMDDATRDRIIDAAVGALESGG